MPRIKQVPTKLQKSVHKAVKAAASVVREAKKGAGAVVQSGGHINWAKRNLMMASTVIILQNCTWLVKMHI